MKKWKHLRGNKDYYSWRNTQKSRDIRQRPTCLATDYSKKWHWILATSKALCVCSKQTILLSPKLESDISYWSLHSLRYASTEGEALAVVDARVKARHFVLDCPNMMIVVDHKILLKVFGDRSLDAIPNPRLRNLIPNYWHYGYPACRCSHHITQSSGKCKLALSAVKPNERVDGFNSVFFW